MPPSGRPAGQQRAAQAKPVRRGGPAKKSGKSAPAASDPADWETIPMFEMKQSGRGAEPTRDRVVAHAKCPHHLGERRTGLVRTAVHLAYRYHEITTWSGNRIPCGGAGVLLCQAPDAEKKQLCDCQRGTRWRP